MGVEEETDSQIGVVWNQSVINEIIQSKCFEKVPYERLLSSGELLESMQDILKTYSHKGLENIKNPEMPSRYYVRYELLKKIKGRTSPDSALEAVIRAAETYDGPLLADE